MAHNDVEGLAKEGVIKAASARWPGYKCNKIVSAKQKGLDDDDVLKHSKEQMLMIIPSAPLAPNPMLCAVLSGVSR